MWGAAGLILAISAGLAYQRWASLAGAGAPQETAAAEPASPAARAASAAAPALAIASRQEPVPVLSLADILAHDGRGSGWQLARLRDKPSILILEFPSLLEQGLALNRAAAFIEKKHSAGGAVLGDAEMQRLLARSGDSVATFYFGHDYSAEQLQRFFAQAQVQGLKLNAQELKLQSLLQAQGLLTATAAAPSTASPQALVSFTAVQQDDPATPSDEQVDALRRESTLRHELSHGEFFTNPDYQRRCWAFWQQGLNEAERARFRSLLSSMDYDPGNEALMVNETQALLMHTPDQRAFNASSLGVTEAQLQALRERFRQQP